MDVKHVPGFIEKAEEFKAKGVSEILLISVNDPFVIKAFAKTYPDTKFVKFLADGSAKYIHALGLELDLSEKGMGIRSRRFAAVVDDLKVKTINLETGGEFSVSGAEDLLKTL
nr:PREDICTED: peroxiredoxin-2B-like [Daucus carota subsp. sativus]